MSIDIQKVTAKAPRGNLEHFEYDNVTVRNFAIAATLWGIVGMLVGLIAALQLIYPALNL